MRRLATCVLMFCFAGVMFAEQLDVRIDSIKTFPVNCGGDGSVMIYFGGDDAPRAEAVIYHADTVPSLSPLIRNLTPGTYEIIVSGWVGMEPFCLFDEAVVGGDESSPIPINAWVNEVKASMPGTANGEVAIGIGSALPPYKVTVRQDGAVVATQTFLDFQEEYIVKNVPGGECVLAVSDSCSTAELVVSVPVLEPAYACGFMQMSPVPGSRVEVEISMLPELEELPGLGMAEELRKYYEEHMSGERVWWEYSLVFDEEGKAEWRDLPADGVLRDTLLGRNYCDVWDKDYSVQVRVKGTNVEEGECVERATIERPQVHDFPRVSVVEPGGCEERMFINFQVAGDYYHPPLSMKVVNLSRQDTTSILYEGPYEDEILIPVENDMAEDSLFCELTDANGCTFGMKKKLDYQGYVDYWHDEAVSSPCSEDFVGVYYSRRSKPKRRADFSDDPPANTVVELLQAPKAELCFRAVWNRSLLKWEVDSKRFDITTDRHRVGIRGVRVDGSPASLPSGRYEFRVMDECGYDTTFVVDTQFYWYEKEEAIRADNLLYTCEGVKYFPKSKITRSKYTVDGYEPAEEMETFFTVVSSDGGQAELLDSVVNRGAFLVDPTKNGGEHRFTVVNYCLPDSCVIGETEVLYRTPPKVAISSMSGYKCAAGDGVITVIADSTTGVQPYRFFLYSASGKELGDNDTGVFEVSPDEDSYQVRVTTGCLANDAAYSETGLEPVKLLDIGRDTLIVGRKVICMGEKDSLSCLLNMGVCEWTRPDKSVEKGHTIEVSFEEGDQSAEGWYYLNIDGLGCDATDSIFVRMERPYRDTIYLDAVCDSELPFEHDGLVFEEGGFLTKQDWGVNGCDSLTTYFLPVYPTYLLYKKVSICGTELPYVYGDTVFDVGTQSGSYALHRQTVHGCDSVVNLLLIVGEAKETVIRDQVFKYESYSKYGFDLPVQREVGEFEHFQHLYTSYGCDSTVHLILSVYPIVKARILADSVSVCGDGGLAIEYDLIEGFPDFCHVRFSEEALMAGFSDFTDYAPDGVSTLVEVPVWIRPNDYSLTFSLENDYGYVDEHTLKFTVLYPSSVVLQMWNDVLAVMSAEYNGGYEFTNYRWYKNGRLIRGETKSYLYMPLDLNAEYHVELTRLDDGVVLPSCPVVPEAQQEVSVYPTVVDPLQNLVLNADEKGTVRVWTSSGIKVSEQTFEVGKNRVPAPGRPGAYLLDIDFENGVRMKQMIIVR